MLNLSNELKQALLDGRVCQYIKLTLKNDDVIAITNHNKSFTVDGVKFKPSPNLSAIQMLQVNGTQVGAQKVFSTWFEGIFDMDSLMSGVYDDADIEVGWVGWDMSPVERMVIFSGRVGEINFNDEGLAMEGLDDMKLLENNYGRTYSTHDPFTFGDTTFGLTEAGWVESGEVDIVLSNRLKFKATGTAGFESKELGWFSYGKITFLTGNNAGWSGEVKIHDVNPDANIGISIELYIPTPFIIEEGDTFEVVAGYDGSFAQCRDKFNNAVNFGGFPHIRPLGEQQ